LPFSDRSSFAGQPVMTSAYLIHKTLLLSLYLCAPLVGAVVVLGVIIGFIQTIMQLQEQSLPFGIKLVVVVILLVILGEWMTGQLLGFLNEIFDQIPYMSQGR
jgi:type III secretion HrpO family protein